MAHPVNKRVLFFCIIILIATKASAQKDSVINQPKSILQKSIDYSWIGGDLITKLKDLGSRENIRFSYSDDLLEGKTVVTGSAQSQPLYQVLDRLLSNYHLSYMLLNNIVVIIEEAEENSQVDGDSINTQQVVGERQIHVSERVMYQLPPALRKKLWSHYKKEVKRNKGAIALKDSTETRERVVYLNTQKEEFSYEFQFNIGPAKASNRTSAEKYSDWNEDLEFYTKKPTGIQVDILAAWSFDHFWLKSGFTYQTYNFQGRYEEVYFDFRHDNYEIISFEDKFRFYSLPISLIYRVYDRRLYIETGAGIRLSAIKMVEGDKNRYETRYYDIYPQDTYENKLNSLLFSVIWEVQAGYTFEHIAIVAGFQYNRMFTPLIRNSFFRLYPDSFVYKVGISYRLY